MEKEFFCLVKKDWLVTPAMVSASKNKKSLDQMYCHISGISGTKYVDSIPSRIARNVTYGELKPAPHNEFDPNAIEVWYGNTMLGWVPARYAEKLAPCVSYLRQQGNRCIVPVEVEDFTDHYAPLLEEPWIDIDQKREMQKLMFSFTIQLPTFWTLFIGFRIASCFEELDIIWDHFSDNERESISQDRFRLSENTVKKFYDNKHLAIAFPLFEPRNIENNWLLHQYLRNYRRRINRELKAYELRLMKWEMYQLHLQGQPATKISKSFPRSTGTVRKYINEMKAEAQNSKDGVLSRPSNLTEKELRRKYQIEWSEWARSPEERDGEQTPFAITG
ncbi:HIRAN domain-containing protein [Corynebacterium minutissimum]|uniref:HIRAN domain-containing protein n=1 Tax=Corynebacterium minutissimum TaxID=38301 RepID=A0A2X4RNS2_9CORY|nr:HIRAN domain-containing protein [Corynebacterium minutissimum]KHO30047.1 hypothetical protein NX84_04220 [Corynebacterium minutissimum]QPS60532.1 hypothetical protein I6G51_04880 [Corynebacterium minutissimum]QQA78680.1 hypothetical protein I6H49_07975 [Corynebacterium minutissimum]SQI00608.1 Uncharacterised protein [Corynebacterium minutissimum]VEG05324.1 Uncharacterised protein [Corynebacterium minutissimum]